MTPTPGRIADPWGDRTPFAQGRAWPQRVDVALADGVAEDDVDEWVQSACVLCSNCCGLDIAVKDGRIAGVRGRARDRVNRGRLGPKGLYGWQANNADDRLTRPLVRDGDRLVDASWDDAMSRIVDHLDGLEGHEVAFYNTGQLFLEEYYTLAVVAKAGVQTPHTDGNTRLCTATASFSLAETFGSDGQPASYDDIDRCDTLFLVGHNPAETQTVLWARILDRIEGADPPRLVVVDPRATRTASRSAVHLPIRNGTNLALLNAITHELIENGWVNEKWVADHTIGFDNLAVVARRWPPERAAEICGVDAADIRAAAEIIGTAERLVSTALQGVYQSHMATASACAVNNINLLRGMIGRPGCGILQMNGQPTSQNTRECGANGELPGFRNWQNEAHVSELADLWNVEPSAIPHWGPPTHAMQIFRYAEAGVVRFLWVIGTNPAVSLPELRRIRSVLSQDRLFLVVSDAFLSETAAMADVVLPAALWGEKLGTFTNTDRTVHISEAAVEPPGEAKSDFDILLDFADRMGFKDKDGAPLVKWSDPEGAFDAWRECSAGRLCDYSDITYSRLRSEGYVQWGGPRLYADGDFPTDPMACSDYGHDLVTGASNTEADFQYMNPAGRAILKSADYLPPHEEPSEEYPLRLTTGRLLYHWHTRTKTGRAPELQAAAPEAWVQLSESDAAELGIADDDRVVLESARGSIEVPARIGSIRPGVVFVPFHYGDRAANELTITEWDPVSKQPIYKTASVRVRKAGA